VHAWSGLTTGGRTRALHVIGVSLAGPL
jgi:hypothetical protein